MNTTTLMFLIFAVLAVIFSVLTITTQRIIRAATYLLAVLLCTAGIYFTMDYAFLGAVQILVYAGGIVVLYVFSIFLTSQTNKDEEDDSLRSKIVSVGAVVAGVALCSFIVLTHKFTNTILIDSTQYDISVERVGQLLLSPEYGGMLLPFELISVLLLACIITGVIIARKH